MSLAPVASDGRRWRPSLLLTLAVPLIYVIVFGAFLFREGDSDWDQILSFHEISLWNWRLYGDAKQWNPLMRGGMSLAGDPQVPVFSLSMILAREIDPAAAMKISVLFFLLVGGIGTWLFARDLKLGRATAAPASALFAGNGYIDFAPVRWRVSDRGARPDRRRSPGACTSSSSSSKRRGEDADHRIAGRAPGGR